ncbi:MAG: MFS transporter [Candidatus Sumerlaeaceae bacterium]|nr:MFS transporter [Candidatus Sumerlaeaceae bacterium]
MPREQTTPIMTEPNIGSSQQNIGGRAAELLGLRRNLLLLLLMMVMVGLGERLFQRFLPRYITDLGAGPIVVGCLGFLNNGLNAFYALPGGTLTDRIGHRKSLVLFGAMNLLGYALLAVPWWPAVLAAVFFCTAWSSLSLPATFSLVAHQLPPGKRVMGLAVQGIVRRIPMAIGPVIGGAVFAKYGTTEGMWIVLPAAAALTLFAIGVQWRLAEPEEPASANSKVGAMDVWRGFRPELRKLLLSDVLIRFCEQIPEVFVVLWVTSIVGLSDYQFGKLSAIEMATAASLYIPVAYWIDRRVQRGHDAVPFTERKPFILATFLLFALFPVALYFSHGWWALVAAFVIRGFKEFGEPARKATIVDLAAPGQKAQTVGVYYFIRDSIVAVAALSGGFLWKVSPALNLWTAFGCGVAGAVVFAATSSRRTEPSARIQ